MARRLALLRRNPSIQVGGLILLVVLAPTLVQDPYAIAVLTGVMMFSLPALGSWLLLSAGLWSFGQGVFALIGSYGVTLLVMRLGLPFWFALPMATAAAAAVGWLIAFPALRASGVAFAILTMAGLLAAYQVITVLPDITGGAGGIVGVPAPADLSAGPLRVSFGAPESYYFLAAALFALCLITTVLVAHSHVFVHIRAVASNPKLTQAVGLDNRRILAGIMAFAAFWTAVAGGFSAPYLGVAHPLVWYVFPSIFIVAYPIIGGIGSLYGALLGTLAIIAGSEALRLTQQAQPTLVGFGLIAITLLLPRGIIGALERVGKFVWRMRGGTEA